VVSSKFLDWRLEAALRERLPPTFSRCTSTTQLTDFSNRRQASFGGSSATAFELDLLADNLGHPIKGETMRIKSLLFACALVSLLPAGQALAAPCSGFMDVQDTDFFCSSVDWLKNRQITLGCSIPPGVPPGPDFCPNEPVLRSQMALFMDRLGTALTPSFAVIEQGGLAVDLDVDTFSCVSGVYTITDFPRTAVLTAHFSGLFAGAANYSLTVRYNNNGNGTTFPGIITGNFEIAGASGANWASASTTKRLDLDKGSTYQFAIRTFREPTLPLGGNDLLDSRCHLVVEIQNRRGSSSPFDAAPQKSNSPDEL
jgi:hypothetical protein